MNLLDFRVMSDGVPLAVETAAGIWEVWGVTSYGLDHCNGSSEWPDFYSDIYGVLDWMEEVTGGPCPRYKPSATEPPPSTDPPARTRSPHVGEVRNAAMSKNARRKGAPNAL